MPSLVLLAAVAVELTAQVPTRILVRVVAHDAKIIGSGVGGATVYVRDPATGQILAEGVQEGGTGSTSAIVVEPVRRGASIYDTDGAAVFVTEVSLARPTVLEFVGEGPLGFAHAAQRASKTMLVLPGEHILGDGIILDLHGFVVELQEPTGSVAPGGVVPVSVRVRMMCGCPLEPKGLWDADRIQVRAIVYHEGRLLRSSPLHYAGTPNMFGGTISLDDVPAGAELVVVASDPSRANFGISPIISTQSP
jgi:hypothetical protein